MTALDWAVLIACALGNIVAFVLMGVDKWRAVKDRWRIPERVLLAACACLGGLGGYTGMQVFRHKLRKPRFAIGVPVMMLLQIVLATLYIGYWR